MLACRGWFPSQEVDLKSNKNVFGQSHNVYATSMPASRYVLQEGHYCRSKGSQFSDMDDHLSPLEARIVPSRIVDTNL